MNGSYDRVARCRLSRRRFSVDLRIGPGAVETIEVLLSPGDRPFGAIRAGLGRIFRDRPGVLLFA